MLPSFYSLFKRGKYLRRGQNILEGTEKEYRDAERFAVSAIGFCIQHDNIFKKHFINSICEFSFRYSGEQVDVRIEDERWGDLVLKMSPKAVAVIECKINADLQFNQNPNEPIFWESGYGKEILEHSEIREFPERHYIILGFRKKLVLPSRNVFYCHQKDWLELNNCPPDSPHSPLALDLFDCLGQLGIDTFLTRRTNEMNVASKAETAAKAYAILMDTATTLGLTKGQWDLETNYSKDGSWCFGADLKQTRNPSKYDIFDKLQKIVKPMDSIGWFGYEGDESASKLTVWFYCSTDKAQKEIRTRLERSGIVEQNINQDGHAIGVLQSAPFPKEDKEWFSSIIKSVAQ